MAKVSGRVRLAEGSTIDVLMADTHSLITLNVDANTSGWWCVLHTREARTLAAELTRVADEIDARDRDLRS